MDDEPGPTSWDELTPAEALARYPEVGPLLSLDPPWRFCPIIGTLLAAKRETRRYVDFMWIASADRVNATRRTARRWKGKPVSEVDFIGSLADTVRLFLEQDDRRSGP